MVKTRYVVLFRGVGGATQLPVKELRAVLGSAGFEKVATYINSGNAVLTSTLDEAGVVKEIAALAHRDLGFEKAVMARSAADWNRMITENPYPEAEEEPTKVHVFALDTEPEKAAVAALEEKTTGTERFTVRGRTLYVHTPDGMGRSKFAPKMEPTLKVTMTGRNWRSMLALQKMAADG